MTDREENGQRLADAIYVAFDSEPFWIVWESLTGTLSCDELGALVQKLRTPTALDEAADRARKG